MSGRPPSLRASSRRRRSDEEEEKVELDQGESKEEEEETEPDDDDDEPANKRPRREGAEYEAYVAKFVDELAISGNCSTSELTSKQFPGEPKVYPVIVNSADLRRLILTETTKDRVVGVDCTTLARPRVQAAADDDAAAGAAMDPAAAEQLDLDYFKTPRRLKFASHGFKIARKEEDRPANPFFPPEPERVRVRNSHEERYETVLKYSPLEDSILSVHKSNTAENALRFEFAEQVRDALGRPRVMDLVGGDKSERLLLLQDARKYWRNKVLRITLSHGSALPLLAVVTDVVLAYEMTQTGAHRTFRFQPLLRIAASGKVADMIKHMLAYGKHVLPAKKRGDVARRVQKDLGKYAREQTVKRSGEVDDGYFVPYEDHGGLDIAKYNAETDTWEWHEYKEGSEAFAAGNGLVVRKRDYLAPLYYAAGGSSEAVETIDSIEVSRDRERNKLAFKPVIDGVVGKHSMTIAPLMSNLFVKGLPELTELMKLGRTEQFGAEGSLQAVREVDTLDKHTPLWAVPFNGNVKAAMKAQDNAAVSAIMRWKSNGGGGQRPKKTAQSIVRDAAAKVVDEYIEEVTSMYSTLPSLGAGGGDLVLRAEVEGGIVVLMSRDDLVLLIVSKMGDGIDAEHVEVQGVDGSFLGLRNPCEKNKDNAKSLNFRRVRACENRRSEAGQDITTQQSIPWGRGTCVNQVCYDVDSINQMTRARQDENPYKSIPFVDNYKVEHTYEDLDWGKRGVNTRTSSGVDPVELRLVRRQRAEAVAPRRPAPSGSERYMFIEPDPSSDLVPGDWVVYDPNNDPTRPSSSRDMSTAECVGMFVGNAGPDDPPLTSGPRVLLCFEKDIVTRSSTLVNNGNPANNYDLLWKAGNYASDTGAYPADVLRAMSLAPDAEQIENWIEVSGMYLLPVVPRAAVRKIYVGQEAIDAYSALARAGLELGSVQATPALREMASAL